MTRTDRVLIGLLVLGVWILVLAADVHPPRAFAAVIDTSEVDGLEDLIEDVVENCNVSGEVYIWDPEGGYGELESVNIDC